MTLGQHIQELRSNAGLSQESLSKQLNISRRMVSKWESDDAIPDLNSLIALSGLFGVSIGTLLDIKGFEAPPIPEGMTAQEWKAIETFLAQNKQAPKKTKTMGKWVRYFLFAAVAVICLLILLWIRFQ